MEDRELLLSFTQSFIESVLIPFQTMFRKRLSSMQLRVMLFLCRKGPSTMTELSEAMSVPRQQTTQIVDRLHEMGLVERVREESDPGGWCASAGARRGTAISTRFVTVFMRT